MDSIQMHLDIENSLNQTLKQTQVLMNSFNKSLEISAKNMGSIEKTAKSTTIQFDDIEDSTEGIAKNTINWSSGLSKIRSSVSYLVPKMATLFSVVGIIEAGKAALDFNTQLKSLSFQMGEYGKDAVTMRKATFGIVRDTGLAQENALQLVKTLRQSRIAAEDIRELGTATARYSELTGVSAESAAKLSAELVRTGGLSVKVSKAMITSMAQLQRQVGMTGSEMEQLGDIIIEDTKWLNQMDKSSGFIEDFNRGTLKLAGAFRQVGIDVSEVGQLMDRMLDPGRIEENALLYAKLGISMQDALSGELDPGMMTEKLKGLGEQLKGMGGPAAAALAQSLGMPLKQLRQMADIDTTKIGMEGGDLGAMVKEQESSGQKIEKTMNRIEGFITNTMSIMVEGLDKFSDMPLLKKGTWIAIAVGAGLLLTVMVKNLKKKFFALATDFGKTLTTATTEAITMGQQKAAISSSLAPARSGRREAKLQRVEAGPEFKGMEDTANYFDVLADSDLFPAIKNMSKNTADWLRKVALGSKGVSRLAQITQENNQSIRDRVGMYSNEQAILTNTLELTIQKKNEEESMLSTRLKDIKALPESARRQKEARIIANELEKIIDQTSKLEDKRNGIQERFEKSKRRQINLLEPQAQKQLAEEISGRQDLLQGQMSGFQERSKHINLQKVAVSDQLNLQKQMVEQQAMFVQNGQGSTDELLKATRQMKEMESLFEELNNESNELQINMADTRKELGLSNKEMRELEKATDKTADQLAKIDVSKREGFLTRMNRAVSTTLNKAASNLRNSFKVARESASAMGQSIVEKLNPSNWLKSIRASVRGFTDREGKETRGIMKGLSRGMRGLGGTMRKLAGPLALLGGVMLLLKPLLDSLKTALAPAMDMLTDVMFDLAEMIAAKILPAIIDIAIKLLPILGKLIDKLLPPILKVIGKLVEVIAGGLIKIIGKLILGMARLGFAIKAGFTRESKIKEELLGSTAMMDAMQVEFQKRADKAGHGQIIDKAYLEDFIGKESTDIKALYAEFGAASSALGKVANGIIDFGETIEGVGRSVYETGVSLEGGTMGEDLANNLIPILQDVADRGRAGTLIVRPDGSTVDGNGNVVGPATGAGGQAAQLYAEGGGVRVGSEAEMSVVDTGTQTADNTGRSAEAGEVAAEEAKKQTSRMDILITGIERQTGAIERLITQMVTSR